MVDKNQKTASARSLRRQYKVSGGEAATAPGAFHTAREGLPEDLEAGAWNLVTTFDRRLAEAERRIDRVLARLEVE